VDENASPDTTLAAITVRVNEDHSGTLTLYDIIRAAK
jgi:hypothetical protein